jgi:hypothetical protein
MGIRLPSSWADVSGPSAAAHAGIGGSHDPMTTRVDPIAGWNKSLAGNSKNTDR